MQLGQSIQARGPIQLFPSESIKTLDRLVMICGGAFQCVFIQCRCSGIEKSSFVVAVVTGTGVTPMLQIMRSILSDSSAVNDQRLKLQIIFANSTDQDIMMREELEALALEHSNVVQLHLLVSKLTKQETRSSYLEEGRISIDLLRRLLASSDATERKGQKNGTEDHPPMATTMITFCGPPGFEKAMEQHLRELGFPNHSIFKF